ncbi:hypothetical protein GALL_303230 [mine drainage metagenome]|uniref:Uncharacterized protein n=1 Tax=mine drainage metagenome TaxID=410659 RepID=A0A1J5QW89_9ZZZZ
MQGVAADEQPASRAVLVVVDAAGGELQLLDQLGGVCQPVLLGVERVPLVGQRGQPFELGQLRDEPFALGVARAGVVPCRVQPLVERLPRAPGLRARLALRAGLRVGVEQVARGVGAHQTLPRVLAVDVDQPLAGGAQLRQRRRAAVDEGARAPLRVDQPAQQHLVAAFKALLVQPFGQLGRRIKRGRDLGPRAAGAQHRRVAALAQRQLQRIDQDGLAGAGFAGEHAEAGAELEVDFVDQHEVAQMQAPQHQSSTGRISCQRSFLRKVVK